MDEDQLTPRNFHNFWTDRDGSAVEFALTLPALLFLLLGTINVFLAAYANVNLHSATVKAARWASTQVASGASTPTSSTVTTYANTQYVGPGINPTYTLSTTGTCGALDSSSNPTGYAVTATGTFQVYYGFGTIPFHLRTASCFPSQVQPVAS
jgi:Flp pilus assembly protein TadG